MVKRTVVIAFLAITQSAIITKHPAQEKDLPRKKVAAIAAKELWTKENLFLGIAEFSPDRSQIGLGCADGMIRIWQTCNADEKLAWQAHKFPIRQLVFHPKLARVASCTYSSLELKCWDLKSGREIWNIGPYIGALHGLVFDPNGSVLATWGSDKTSGYSVKLWDSETGMLKGTIPSPNRISAVAFDPNGQILAYCVQYYENKKSLANIVLWNLEKGKQIRTIENVLNHASSNTWIWYSTDAKRIITADITQIVQVWDAETGNLIHRNPGIEGKVFSRFRSYGQVGDLLASSRMETKDIIVFSPNHPEKSLTLEGRIGHVALSPDGKLLANFMGRKLSVWQIETKAAK